MLKEVKWVFNRWYLYFAVILWAFVVLYINGFTIPFFEWIINIPVVFYVFVVIILTLKFFVELIISIFSS